MNMQAGIQNLANRTATIGNCLGAVAGLAVVLSALGAGNVWAQAQLQSPAKTLAVGATPPPFVFRAVPDELQVGQIKEGSLTEGKTAQAVYRLVVARPVLTGRMALQIDARSSAIDTRLAVYKEGEVHPLLEDDDGGGGSNARLVLAPDLLRTPLIIVVNERSGLAGRFDLVAASVEAAPPPPGLQFGAVPIQGVLDANSARREGLAQPFAQYRLTAQAGQRVRLNVDADGFNPSVELLFNDVVVARDDDSGPGLNAQLIRTLTNSGVYTLQVLSSERTLGAFRVSAKLVDIVRDQRTPQLLENPSAAVTTTILADLNEKTPLLGDRPYDVYRLAGHAGDRFEARLEDQGDGGNHTRMTVESGVETAAGFASLARNTASAATSGAKIKINFFRDGEVLLRVMGGVDWLGGYSLELSTAAPEPNAGRP